MKRTLHCVSLMISFSRRRRGKARWKKEVDPVTVQTEFPEKEAVPFCVSRRPVLVFDNR